MIAEAQAAAKLERGADEGARPEGSLRRTQYRFFSRSAQAPTNYEFAVDFALASGAAIGDVTGTLTRIDIVFGPILGSTSGCEAADFAGFAAGGPALLQRGTCNFTVKVQNATNAGASAVVLFNDGGTPERMGLVTPQCLGCAVPTIFTTFALGLQLAGGTQRIVRLNTDPFAAPDPDRTDVSDPVPLAMLGFGLAGLLAFRRRTN